MIFNSTSENETEQIASQVAKTLSFGDVLLLNGNLGVGKSVFARGLIRGMLNDPTHIIPSPTFSLVQTYDYDGGQIWHFDLYRLTDPDDILEIGWEEALSSGIVLVEWPERLGPWAPKNSIIVTIQPTENNPAHRLIDVRNQNE
jgi:tRNA threonylcarbamoyladenosine biosynthesis protein TsaE